MVVRTRRWTTPALTGVEKSYPGGSFYNYNTAGKSCYETVETFSHSRRGNGYTGGGPFNVWREIHEYTPSDLQIQRFYNTSFIHLQVGGARIGAPTSGTDLTPYSPPSDLQLASDGTTAIARTEPLNPSFDLATLIGELRMEGIPNTPGASVMERTKLANKAGSEYLNYEFGWAPLVRGVRDFAKTVEQSDKIIRSHQENANRVIQRSYEWPVLSDSKYRDATFVEERGAAFFTGGGRFQQSFQKKWFEAEYQYFLPTGTALNDKVRRYGSYARKLLGVDLSPEVLWNLSPWSWAADWFGTTGDVMHNISALGQDGLVLRNGYIMCHTRFETVDSGTLDGGHHTYHQRHRHVVETKQRREATPFGFGVSFSGLNQKQIAIVSALGLSKWQ